MKYCKKCLQPDTRTETQFNLDVILPASDYTFNVHLTAVFDARFKIL